MTWLSWRQLRTQALVATVALVLFSAALLVVGLQIRHGYDSQLADCRTGCAGAREAFKQKYSGLLYLLDAVVLLAPALLGMFWGAPLVARELEHGTHRLVWNQSVTRRRWLLVKLLVVGGVAMFVTAVLSTALTWAASPYDAVAADRFTGLLFGVRNVAPVAYASFALVLGAVLGLLLRRTLPAMALLALVLVVVQVMVPLLIRPNLLTPRAAELPMTAAAVANLAFLGEDGNVSGVKIPAALVVSTSDLLEADGRRVDLGPYHRCVAYTPEEAPPCIAALHLHVEVKYQPGSRYWLFQWLESALYVGLALLLAGVGLWRIR
jgi:hypothetical protein